MPKFIFLHQRNQMDCGPTCLAMICRYYGKNFNIQSLRNKTEIGKEGVNLLGINNAAESIGFRTQGVQLTFAQLINEAPLPCILHWGQNHFVVASPGPSKGGVLQFIGNLRKRNRITIVDPARGKIVLTKKNFCKAG